MKYCLAVLQKHFAFDYRMCEETFVESSQRCFRNYMHSLRKCNLVKKVVLPDGNVTFILCRDIGPWVVWPYNYYDTNWYCQTCAIPHVQMVDCSLQSYRKWSDLQFEDELAEWHIAKNVELPRADLYICNCSLNSIYKCNPVM